MDIPGEGVRGVIDLCLERVNSLGLQSEVLMRQPLRLLPHVPLAQADLHAVDLGAETWDHERISDTPLPKGYLS